VTPSLKSTREVLTAANGWKSVSASCSRRSDHGSVAKSPAAVVAQIVAELDVLASLGEVAAREGYVVQS